VFFAAPTNGMAFSPVSMIPLKKPFRFIVATTVATAIAVPMIGTERETRRESLAPPQRTNLFVVVAI
jgi:hypothetical protein